MKLKALKESALASFCGGFTLIELLVVFGILIVVGSIGLFYYRGYGRRQTVTQAAETLRTSLTQIRQKALAGERPSNCAIAVALTSYQFSWTANDYSVLPQCGWTAPLPPPVPLPSSVTMSALPGCPATAVINFNTLARGTDLTSNCTLRLVGFGYSSTLTIDQSGNIE